MSYQFVCFLEEKYDGIKGWRIKVCLKINEKSFTIQITSKAIIMISAEIIIIQFMFLLFLLPEN